MTSDRVWRLEGVHNFRDYGGYPVSGGGRLRRGQLWRSGEHFGASDADLDRIAGIGLANVFDLRTSVERQAHPCRRPAGFGGNVHHALDPSGVHAPHLAAAMLARHPTAEAMHESMLRNYARICFRPELQEIMRRYLAGLAEGSGPSLVNCLAGKDRTGIAVAMLHLATGVHRDDILEDYVLTNNAGDSEARIAAGARAIHDAAGGIDYAAVRVLMSVTPEYLEAAFASIEERHGSIDAYLAEVLGADAALREKLREALVEG